MYVSLLFRLAVAISIGLSIGYERDIHAKREGIKVFYGIWIFSAMALLGFLSAYARYPSSIIIIISSSMVIMLFSIPNIYSSYSPHGMTTGIALVLTLLTGSISALGYPLEALLIGGMILTLLALKKRTHKFAGILTYEELASALHFLAILLILLPLAYTMGVVHPLIGPGLLLDPVKILLIVIFVSTMSFVSYLIIRTIGSAKGLELSSFLGGFVNSAASTVSLSRLSAKYGTLRDTSIRGIILSNISMILKDMILIAVLIGMIFLRNFLVPVTVLVFASISGIFFIKRLKVDIDHEMELGSPFAIIPAAKFGLLFVLMSILSFYGKEYFGSYGVYAISLGGLISTTSVSASLAALYTTGEISMDILITTILFAIGLGSISKIGIAWAYDPPIAKKIMIIQGLVAILSILMASLYI